MMTTITANATKHATRSHEPSQSVLQSLLPSHSISFQRCRFDPSNPSTLEKGPKNLKRAQSNPHALKTQSRGLKATYTRRI
jgi:hypothetical protein